MLVEFIDQYGLEIMYMTITAIAGYVGIVIKNLCAKYINDKTKQAVARSAVQFVEQVYKNLHGEDKLNAALTASAEMLTEKGISVTDLELRVLIEAAVSEFNKAFEKPATETLPKESE